MRLSRHMCRLLFQWAWPYMNTQTSLFHMRWGHAHTNLWTGVDGGRCWKQVSVSSWVGLSGRGVQVFRNYFWASLVAQVVKNLPIMQKTQVQSLDLEDCLENGMATHSHMLAEKITWTEKPGKLQSMGSQRAGHHWATYTSLRKALDSTRTMKESN